MLALRQLSGDSSPPPGRFFATPSTRRATLHQRRSSPVVFMGVATTPRPLVRAGRPRTRHTALALSARAMRLFGRVKLQASSSLAQHPAPSASWATLLQRPRPLMRAGRLRTRHNALALPARHAPLRTGQAPGIIQPRAASSPVRFVGDATTTFSPTLFVPTLLTSRPRHAALAPLCDARQRF